VITDQQVIEAGRIILQARKERGPDAGAVPDAVAAALGKIGLPDDAIAKGPRAVLTDAEIDANLSKLSTAGAQATASLGLVRTVFGLFGLGGA
jgi:hypothetical protein